MEKLMIILMIAAIIVLVLCAIFLLIKIFKMIDFDFSSNKTIKKSDFDIARDKNEKERIEREKEAEERRNYKPRRNRMFIPSELPHGEEVNESYK